VLAEPVEHVRELGPAFVPHLQAALVGEIDRVHRLAVDVELQLVGGAVADPNRARAAVALEMVEDLLLQVRGAVDPVHDPQRPGGPARLLPDSIPEPTPVGRGLLGVAEP
jgi:hypothetical protein